jgi:two-component system chemotaxis response regulator CheB
VTGRSKNPAAVVIGVSAGAVEALLVILPALPETYPLPVLVVVHVPPDRRSLLPALFAERCQLRVKEAEDKEAALPGVIYFAPADYHLLVEPDFTLSLSNDVPVHYSRPAIDVLFQSAADAYGDALTAVVLTGASRDGADGLQAVAAAGGLALVQDPATAEVAAMPLAALEACPNARILSLPEIAALLAAGMTDPLP